MRNYTVAIMAEYNVTVSNVTTDKDIFEAEDAAIETIKSALTGNVEEVEADVVNTYKLLFSYLVKVAANMVLNVSAESYLTAYHTAVEKIESLPYGNSVSVVTVGTYDVTFAEERVLLEKPIAM